MNKRFALVAVGAALALGLSACGGGGAGSTAPGESATSAAPEDVTVGVAMPTQTSQRWIDDGNNVKAGLEELGYKVDLQYANDDIPTQASQISTMINNGDKVLIIASIDGTALSSQLADAAAAGIKIISYDRLIRGTENVDFYVSFDNYKVGVQQGTSLLTGLGILNADGSENPAATGPFNVELFAGSLDDNNATFFYNGAMDTIKPYIDKGVIKIPSGQTDISQIATQQWKTDVAQKRMETLLTSADANVTLNGVLAPADIISRGVITALANDGYGQGSKKFPVVTGQDADIDNVKLINDGQQYSTIFKDTRLLAEEAIKVTGDYLSGKEPEANNTTDYDNGNKVVPSYLLESTVVTKDNIKSVLIDSGYYTQEQVDKGQK
ncbi:sugar ABC transporter substrate-binding protein [Streptomyces sp. NP160]|uniref:multiple monosaccharide ABC transporter substrate-binding protein n=1 Tax=Streptomyces sp. NP160 TaxID=2586637 RepID=UPI00111A13EF|nr:multiple monosaccharide ABC transporter substrate-binding protein [Streptomyces sp. NP160]TNM69976.1 sugar ABC transporter substrate-binding protein [Streptomyces sp. NP160]